MGTGMETSLKTKSWLTGSPVGTLETGSPWNGFCSDKTPQKFNPNFCMTKWVLNGDCQHWVCIQVLAVTHCPPERCRQVSLEIAAWAGKKAPPFILVLWSMKWKPCSETADGATSCSVEGCGEIAWFHSNSGFFQCMGERELRPQWLSYTAKRCMAVWFQGHLFSTSLLNAY